MTITTVSMIYLGNFMQFDTVESTASTVDHNGEIDPTATLIAAGPFTKTNAKIVTVAQDDMDVGGNIIWEDDDEARGVPASTFSYDIGVGMITSKYDYAFILNGTIVLGDGTTVNRLICLDQAQNGDVFIADPYLNGINIQSITFTSQLPENDIGKPDYFASNVTFVCFAGDSMIETQDGPRRIDDLAPGDLVRTADAGFQPIRWMGSRKVDPIDLRVNDRLRPIRIRAGALGEGLPTHDLMVSRQHRMLVRSHIAAQLFNAAEILVPARRLLGLAGVEVAQDVDQVEYFHMLFDSHQVVFANGAPAESLFLGQEALRALSAEARAEIVALFPEVADPDFIATTARPIIAGSRQVEAILQHHDKDGLLQLP